VQALKLGASDFVAKSSTSFRSLYFRLKHLVAHGALLREQSRLRQAYASSVERERATREGFERKLVEARAARSDAERRLKDAAAEVEQALRHRDAEAAAIEWPPKQHHTELLARLAEATASEERLRREIDEILAEHRRQFIHLPVSICRCTQDGEVTMASQDLATLLGCDTPEALQGGHFAAELFESGDQLRRIIDRCLASHSSESLETSWKRSDGSRIIVGVVAFASSSTDVDLVVHDITTLRVLEERLRQSRRMGALGPYASELALTCENLLAGVRREGQELLSRVDDETARHQGALLLDDVTRASALLQRLVECTREQSGAPVQAELKQMLRDLEPVLKRVAGNTDQFGRRCRAS
jgi:PAS domain-containing protein